MVSFGFGMVSLSKKRERVNSLQKGKEKIPFQILTNFDGIYFVFSFCKS